MQDSVEALGLFLGGVDAIEIALQLRHGVSRETLRPFGRIKRFLGAKLGLQAGELSL
jgi:hypothetical protein